MSNTMIKTFVFIHAGTTGLPVNENNQTKLIELCVIAVNSDHIHLGREPRVQNKLNLFFNPEDIPEGASLRLASTIDLLANESPFNADKLNQLVAFLEQLPKPICFVGHNGERFIYPILRKYILQYGINFPRDILCVDTLLGFPPGRIWLPLDVFFNLKTGKIFTPHVTAEVDTKAILECAYSDPDTFIEWANESAIPFDSIPSM